MFVFAYEARHADAPVIDPSTGARFLTTSYSRAEAFARAHGGAVAQVGSGSALRRRCRRRGRPGPSAGNRAERHGKPGARSQSRPKTPQRARKRAPAPAKEASHADCDDPACGLPCGRCAMCGSPCGASHCGTEVCPRCLGAVADFYMLERAGHPDGAGWRLAGVAEDGSAHIERDPARALFPDDEAAGADVIARVAAPLGADGTEL